MPPGLAKAMQRTSASNKVTVHYSDFERKRGNADMECMTFGAAFGQPGTHMIWMPALFGRGDQLPHFMHVRSNPGAVRHGRKLIKGQAAKIVESSHAQCRSSTVPSRLRLPVARRDCLRLCVHPGLIQFPISPYDRRSSTLEAFLV